MMKTMTPIEKYYNSFKEDHRLHTRHGLVEFRTTMSFIEDFIPEGKDVKILDLGAGTGRYSVELCHKGYSVTAVELVKHNLEILRSKHENINTWQGDARNISFLDDDKFDVTLVFGPMYHLHTKEDRLKVLEEAKRVTKKDGYIFVAYIMNEYAVLTYCFKEGNIKKCMEEKSLTEDFHTVSSENDLYSYVRLEDMNELNALASLKRIKVFAPDGASDYMRRELNAMDEETFEYFLKYNYSICQRQDLIGASSHTVDILQNTK